MKIKLDIWIYLLALTFLTILMLSLSSCQGSLDGVSKDDIIRPWDTLTFKDARDTNYCITFYCDGTILEENGVKLENIIKDTTQIK